MAKQQRVNITSDIYGAKKPDVLEKMIAPAQEQREEQPQLTSQETTSSNPAGGRTLKQVAFAIGISRETKLDELVFTYNKQKGTRIGRNDIIRYLIDSLTIDDLLRIDLREYKK
jgi:hypothetical protein